MSSAQSQRRSTNGYGGPFMRANTANRRDRHHSSGFVLFGLHTAGVIGRGPKRLWPYVLPWLFILLTIGSICLVVRGVLARQLLVPPVETPQTLTERGYTANFLAERIMSAMKEIGQDAESIPHDTMTSNDAQQDIQIPGQEMSYATTVRFIKGVLKRDDVAVHIGITKTNSSADSYVAHVQIEHGPFNGRQSTVPFEGRDLEKLVRDIAVTAMRLAEPNILASHLFTQVQKKTKCSLAQCDYREIVGIYDEVLALPSSEQAQWAVAGKAWLLDSQQRSTEAEQQIREALTQYKHSAVLRASLGIALEQQNRIDDALKEMRAGAKEKSRTAENLRLLGDVLLHSKKHDREALEAFRQAAKMNPDSVDTLHDWAEALVKTGHDDEAIDKLSHAVALRPDLAPSYVEWGHALEHKGALREAARKYAQALQLDAGTLSARERELALSTDASPDEADTRTSRPDLRVKPVSNPMTSYPLRASLDTVSDAVGRAMQAA
ncbi:tetratricopeptide repeat protein [Paraburkholderia tuberum]|uniref:Tetratricopeptide repeat-containing protein n=1 Tax=Paraburkholderia tuberum TaxID=157910 RepID=A0A1H1JIB9_9BURK|nr:tetratricopeptide repeat protein [Paraburkholderia tuberum]SDR49395.1 Tetratricopeptide repeat-containing protein [Paraburkholderia tuberum]